MSEIVSDSTRASDRILSSLRTDILTLELGPGQKLATEFLIARYATGQSPLREALSLLVGEGLVVRESGRGFRVSPMSFGDLDDLIATRLMIEPAMLEHAICAGDRTWEANVVDALQTLQPSLQKVGDSRPLDRSWEENHRRFHFALMTPGGPSLLMEFCRMLYDRYDRYRQLGIPRRAYLAGVASDHAEMAGAAIARDAPLAVGILKRHIADTSATVRANIESADIAAPDGTLRIPLVGIDLA